MVTGDPSGPWWGLGFPQWQGAGPGAAPLRARGLELAERYARVVPMDIVPVAATEVSPRGAPVFALETLIRQGRAARELVERRCPDRLFTVGGDCGVEIIPVSYLNACYADRVGVLWFDAHADANTPSTSPSGNFHGMPVRTLLGDGPEEMRALAYSTLRPEQVFLIGARALDPGERTFMAESGVDHYPGDTLGLEDLHAALRARRLDVLYLHVDLDVLDPTEFPSVWYPTPHGLERSRLVHTLRHLRERFTVVGASILECIPDPANDVEVIDEVVFTGFGLDETFPPIGRRDTHVEP